MPIAEGLAAIKTGFDVAKNIAEYVKQGKIDPNEIASRLLVLQQYMLDSQSGLNDAQEEIRQLKIQLEEQKKLQQIADDMEYVDDGGFYIKKSEKAAGKKIPYCRLCWTKDGKAVALSSNNNGYFRCDHDGSHYATVAYRNRQQQRRPNSYGGGPWS